MSTIDRQIAAAEARAQKIKAKIEAAKNLEKQGQEKLKQINQRRERLEEKKLALMIKGQRAAETRRKILLGAYLLHQMEQNKDLREKVISALHKYLKKDGDRALFDLPPLELEPESTPVQSP